ncbi:MAG: STAS domain-containing protein [Gammaproteobacteria bacterium]|nr:STAS domain-containing protein [Gammaproteobacteria bacterium]NIM71632.1 STAS domain-containing protein [Gammaproteobacteria bacterium]NIO64000.1 STAS domain-containing protein [Gammaproteobacteria bacterium]NIP47113.1 STAS domain-containing protein [Gammaproteobacteria bacterium]NIQ25026.1 STAS domain-containing protein [Gammaproteobacteria bacterium]
MPSGDQKRARADIQRLDTRSYGVSGPMTFDTVTELWRQSEHMFEDNTVLEIDLAQVTRTDSAGLSLLVEWMRGASRQSGRVEFLNLPDQMLALARVSNVEHLLAGKRSEQLS